MKIYVVVLLCIIIASCSVADEIIECKNIGNIISVDNISPPSNVRLDRDLETPHSYGVVHSKEELDGIWSQLISVDKVYYGKKYVTAPASPLVDFSRYDVVWFSMRNYGGSVLEGVTFKKTGCGQVVVDATVVFSDFGSGQLGLWKIEKVRSVGWNIKRTYDGAY